MHQRYPSGASIELNLPDGTVTCWDPKGKDIIPPAYLNWGNIKAAEVTAKAWIQPPPPTTPASGGDPRQWPNGAYYNSEWNYTVWVTDGVAMGKTDKGRCPVFLGDCVYLSSGYKEINR